MATNYWYDKTKDFQRFPALKDEATIDVLIVGGGITGLLTAWHLQKVGKKIAIIEKNHLATGATGASTGFVTRPIDTLYPAVLTQYGLERTKGYTDALIKAQEDLIALIIQEKIVCDLIPTTSHYIAYGKNDPVLTEEWAAIKILDQNTTKKKSDQPWYAEEITFEREASIDLRSLTIALANKIVKSAGKIYEETPALSITKKDNHWVVQTPSGSVLAKQIVIATGAPDHALFPELKDCVVEKITHAATFRTSKLPLSGGQYWDTNKPYFYFLPLDKNRILMGGLDHNIDQKITDPEIKLQSFLQKILPGKYSLEHVWSGSLFVSPDHLPLIFEHPQKLGIYVATGYAGVGIVPSMLAATQITAHTTGNPSLLWPFLGLERIGLNLVLPEKLAKKKTAKTDTQGWRAVAQTKEITEGKTHCVTIDSHDILVTRVEDRYFAVDATCTHAEGKLCGGEIDGTIIECPLHQSRFDLATGAVRQSPAIRPLTTYTVKVEKNTIYIQYPKMANTAPTPVQAPQTPVNTTPLATTANHLKTSLIVATTATVFWLLQFAYQFFVLIPGELAGALVRSFALAGATLIGSALLLSIIFRFFPALADHWRVRRYLGVSGFILILGHVVSVFHFLFNWNVSAAYWSFNPFENPIIFGAIAFDLFLVMAVTSSDRIVDWLSYPRWKLLHRVAYFAWLAAVMHFIFINPPLLMQPFGYLLLTVTTLVLTGQLYWWIRIAGRRKFLTWGGLVGIIIISLYLVLGYTSYQLRFAPEQKSTPSQSSIPLGVEIPLDNAVNSMKEYLAEMKEEDTPMTLPEPKPTQAITGPTIKVGQFENLNYMTSGSTQIIRKDNTNYLVFGADFVTPDGPDLKVYLTKNTTPTSREDISLGYDLGKLKNLDGVQIYALPSHLNIDEYNAVTIHCKAFNVPWSWAPLNAVN